MRAFLVGLRNRLLGTTVVLSRIQRIERGVAAIKLRQSQKVLRQSQKVLQKTLAECLGLLKTTQISAPATQKLPKMGTLLSGSIAIPGYDCKSNRTELHNNARRICKEGVEIFEDPPELRQLSEAILRETLLPKVDRAQRVLDIGCGNGRYTFLFADMADEIFAFDISGCLIDQAREEANRRKLQNIEFSIADLESGLPHGPFDLIGCMGVLVTIIDDKPYRLLINQLSDRLNTGGFLITKDATSIYPEGNIVASNGYVRNYRHVALYEGLLKKAGFRLIDKIQLIAWDNFVNHFYLWKKLAAQDLVSRRIDDTQPLLERSRDAKPK